MEQEKKGHGGARPGAGNKRKVAPAGPDDKIKTLSVRVWESQAEWINSEHGSLQKFVDNAYMQATKSAD